MRLVLVARVLKTMAQMFPLIRALVRMALVHHKVVAVKIPVPQMEDIVLLVNQVVATIVPPVMEVVPAKEAVIPILR